MKYKQIALILGLTLSSFYTAKAQDGAALFKQNCSACHKLGANRIGPNLLGVNEKREEAWLLKFITSSQTLIKSGDPDAVAIYELFNQATMNDQSHLSEGEIKAILAYIKDETAKRAVTNNETETDPQPKEEVSITEPTKYTDEEVEKGKFIFLGKKSLANGGPACISCHNIDHKDLIPGGLLAKDLTHGYARMGGDAGLAGLLGSPPFPAMAAAYETHPLNNAEITQLTAFMQHADSNVDAAKKNGDDYFIWGGGTILILIFLLVAYLWRSRLKRSVKQDIYNRQIKSV